MAVDGSKNAYVVGRTNSSNFPLATPLIGFGTYQGKPIVDANTLNTQFDGFVSKINTLGSGTPSLIYSTYLGGNDTDQINAVALDTSGNAYVGGQSASTNFPNNSGSPSASTSLFGFFAKISDVASAGAIFSITKTHTGNFTQGQAGTYTVVVSNTGSGASVGTVTVTETAPAGLTITSMSGTGWTCNATSCTRNNSLAAGTSYPAISIVVSVLANATSPQVNQVTVSGGGTPNVTTNDSTIIQGGTATFSLSVNRKVLNFGTSGTLVTSPQTVLVTIAGANASWTVSSNQSNITVNPTSGVGTRTFQVTATAGPSGTVTVTAPGATGSPQTIQVNVAAVTPTLPFGSFDTPINNTAGVVGAIPVTGWALDNIEVTRVDIFREAVTGEPAGTLIFIGTAVFSADARPDVAAGFPTYPYQYRAGWGYQMLTNFLPNSNGSPGPAMVLTSCMQLLSTKQACSWILEPRRSRWTMRMPRNRSARSIRPDRAKRFQGLTMSTSVGR